MGLVVNGSGSNRVNAHRAGKVHAVAPEAVVEAGSVVALCGSVVQLWGQGLFDSDGRTAGGVCPVCATEHRRTRPLVGQPPLAG